MSKVIEHQKFNSREEFDKALLEQILPIEPDLVVLAGFMRILSKVFTKSLSGKLINIHPSLLPDYPGLNTHLQAIENGDLMHGISVHYVNNELDGGPIITQGALKIDPYNQKQNLLIEFIKLSMQYTQKLLQTSSKDISAFKVMKLNLKLRVILAQIIWNFLMYKYLGILFFLISFDLASQEIPDYKGEYVFTNSRVSMKGIRELISHEETGQKNYSIQC